MGSLDYKPIEFKSSQGIWILKYWLCFTRYFHFVKETLLLTLFELRIKIVNLEIGRRFITCICGMQFIQYVHFFLHFPMIYFFVFPLPYSLLFNQSTCQRFWIRSQLFSIPKAVIIFQGVLILACKTAVLLYNLFSMEFKWLN